MTSVAGIDESLEKGRSAAGRRAWPDAYTSLTAADTEEELAPEDLELLAKAAWWTGRPGETIEFRERAYAGYLARGDKARAAFMALTLRRDYTGKLAGAVAAGWLDRAERLLEDQPESASHGYLALAHGSQAWDRLEREHALAHMARAVEIADRFDDRDLQAWSTMYQGMVLVDMGRVEEGMALLGEVGAAAVGGELGAYTTGAAFCNVISVCRDVADYRRGSEWAEVATHWCERQAITGFPGVCRVYRAEFMRLLGSWSDAEREVRLACDELHDFNPLHAGAAFHELGEICLRTGDLSGAEQAFERAQEFGDDAQPGLSLLLLARGDAEAGAASIRRRLDELEGDHLARSRLLPAKVELARVNGDRDALRDAADELADAASRFGTSAIQAEAAGARACVLLGDGGYGEAVRELRVALRLWREVGAPYEAARTSAILAEAYVGDGDEPAAGMELRRAQASFERLGADPEARRVSRLLANLGLGPKRAIRTFLFTDVVGSTALLEAIGDESWAELRRWHDEVLRRCFARHGGEEVDHAGDGFFVAFPNANAALTCAVEIQRELADHRREHGFAPAVRMGLHATEATTDREGYSGAGVHAAARIGALAAGGEILASEETIAGIDGVALEPVREVELKGLSTPVRVVSVGWRSP
jgi:class 3 adenylate cyclase